MQVTRPLEFAQCASILEHKFRSLCRLTHDMEVVQRRCEKGFFLRSRGTPTMGAPVQMVYALRKTPAWRDVKIIVGIFFEGFTDGMRHDQVVDWMMRQTKIARYKWMIEGNDLFIAPRSRYNDLPTHGQFSAEMVEEIETIAAQLERQDLAIFAIYTEVQIPY